MGEKMIRKKVSHWLKKFQYTMPSIDQSSVELNNISELNKIFNWQNRPILDDPEILKFEYVLDINERRIRDAESIGTVLCNANTSVALEIGTADGHTTALMAENAPNAQIYTINIPPEEILSGKGGKLTTIALEKEKIGSYYRQKNLKNITQIYANSATWVPNIGNIDVAFIDGCHDSEFVYSDTRKVLLHMKPGSYILWHDFNVDLIEKFDWIRSVCQGVEWLYDDKILQKRIFHVKDSWVGIYQV
jgi:predicted O-methyltransferase YrrM